MWGCKRSRTARSSIRMCWYHMFLETSTERFVFRARETPSCTSECVKIQFHVQCKQPETAILTVTSRVFDGCSPKSICDIKNTCEGIVLG
jgi:hypothetical protein